MAESNQHSSTVSSTVVLRIKRKRTDNPIDALVIASKIPKHDPQQVFQLCGSVTETDQSEILEIVSSFKARSKFNPLAQLTLSDIRNEHKQAKKQSSASQRYKILSNRRSLEGIDHAHSSTNDSAHSHSDVIHLYDAVSSNMMDIETPSTNGSSSITCNDSIMTREKIIPSNLEISDFIYDLYYSKHINTDVMDDSDGVYVCPYEEVDLVHDIIESDEEGNEYDYDDDSNDESNWRNDYPEDNYWNSDDDDDNDDNDSVRNDEYRTRYIEYDECGYDNEYDYQSDDDD